MVAVNKANVWEVLKIDKQDLCRVERGRISVAFT